MLTILGPAKTIDTSPHGITDSFSLPEYQDQAGELVEQILKYSISQLKTLMQVSDKLAILNFERYMQWRSTYTAEEGQQAILAFSGEVFNGLQARSLSESDLLFAQEHILLLSGLYGVLRPLDLILPYRLEMGTKMPNSKGRNLASNEYFRSIDSRGFPYQIITPVFKESDGKGFRNVTVYAKKARGMMLRFIIQNRITDPEYLKAFDENRYYFNNDLSNKTDWVFCR